MRYSGTDDMKNGPAGALTPVDPGLTTNKEWLMPKSTCSVMPCGSPSKAKGLCGPHYDMKRRRGLVAPFSEFKNGWAKDLNVDQIIELRTNVNPKTGCIEWGGTLSTQGYGYSPRAYNGTKLVHRIAYMRAVDETVPRYVPIHHTCANPVCANPDHLSTVTQIENTAEMLERKHYRDRIAALEAALMDSAPNHPLLESAK